MKLTLLATLTLSTGLLAGCNNIPQQAKGYISNQPAQAGKPIQVRPVAYRFTVNLAGRQLDDQDRQAVTDFLRSHGPLINQRLVIVERGAVYERRQLERWMRQLGMAGHQLRFQAVTDERRLLDFTTEYFVARTPNCPDSDQQPGTPIHQQHRAANFGCATASNLAMMVSDPRDLVKGRQLAPASAIRATNAVRLYQQYQVTPLAADSNGTGSTSTDGGQ